MAKKVLSIVVGAECTKVCEISYKKNYKNKGIRVYRSITFATPGDMIEDGYIKDKAAFGELLRNKLKAAKIKSDKVIFSINSSKIASREVIIPPTKEKRIMDIIMTGASEYFPVDIRDYVLSYQILEKDTSARKDRAGQKRYERKARKQAKRKEKLERKALKKRSKTEIIADNLEKLYMDNTPDTGEAGEAKPADKPLSASKQMRLSVYAAPTALIKNYYSFARHMHMDIMALDYSGNSSCQIIKRQQKHGTNVFVQMNEKDTLISILREDVLVLQRTVSYGMASLLETVMEQACFRLEDTDAALELLKNNNLLSPESEVVGNSRLTQPESAGISHRKMQPESASLSNLEQSSEIINNISIASLSALGRQEAAAAGEVTVASGMTSPNKQAAAEAGRNIRESLHILCNSIARMLDYYKSSHKQIDIDTIYITGCGVHIKGIEEFFTTEIGIPHKLMDKLATVSANRKAVHFRKSPGEYLYNIGAVIKPVDFVPLEFTLKKQRRSAILGTIVFSLACLVGSAGTVYISVTDYLEAKQELDGLSAQLESMPKLSGAHDEYDMHMAELEDFNKLIDTTASHNDNIKDILAEFESKLPSNTVINSMKFDDNGVQVTMRITAADNKTGANALIAKTLKQLKIISYFGENVNVADSSVSVENGVNVVSLSVTCSYVQ